jgi:DNA-binding XRE family transcriptional regulator
LKLDPNKLKRGRDRLGFTQVMLAEEAGLHTNTIMRAERGGGISHKTARTLARTLRVEVADIIAEEPSEATNGSRE